MEQQTLGARGRQSRRWRWIVALAAAGTMAACSGGGRSEYANDGDTGAASPGTKPDYSTAEMIGTDSTTGLGGRTGRPASAGDTVQARGQPAGTTGPATQSRLADSTALRGNRSSRPPR